MTNQLSGGQSIFSQCYVQRQQLKFLWKILHLNDLALQRIVLHSKLDSQFSRGRGGRQRTFKQCIKDAMYNFEVTMAQCMDMAQQDWDLRIEGIGLESAMQQWEARPKATKPIDKEWRTTAGQQDRRNAQTTPAEPTERAGSGAAEQMKTATVEVRSAMIQRMSSRKFQRPKRIRMDGPIMRRV